MTTTNATNPTTSVASACRDCNGDLDPTGPPSSTCSACRDAARREQLADDYYDSYPDEDPTDDDREFNMFGELR